MRKIKDSWFILQLNRPRPLLIIQTYSFMLDTYYILLWQLARYSEKKDRLLYNTFSYTFAITEKKLQSRITRYRFNVSCSTFRIKSGTNFNCNSNVIDTSNSMYVRRCIGSNLNRVIDTWAVNFWKGTQVLNTISNV